MSLVLRVDLRSNNRERKQSINFNSFVFPQACRENHVDVVELLLDYGASVNAPFPNSRLVSKVRRICFSLKSCKGVRKRGVGECYGPMVSDGRVN